MSSSRRPQMLVCYLCGQQFGTSSLSIHQPQCYQKKLGWWHQGDPATRGPMPKDPAVHGHKHQDQLSQKEIKQQNEDQFEDFNENLSKCGHCGRTFLPDRLAVHQRSCKPGASGGGSKSVTGKPPGGGGGGGGVTSSESPSRPAQRPTMLVCYLCGQQFGTSSLPIHQPQCYEKHLTWWNNNDPATRGPKPKDPKTQPQGVPGKGTTNDQFNDAQAKNFKENLSPCPHCARTFLPDRLQIHLRSCKPNAGGNAGSGNSGYSPASGPQTAPNERVNRQRPTMLVCHLCGQQFGSASLPIHQPQCYKKQKAIWDNADPASRGAAPVNPGTAPMTSPAPSDREAFNNQQFEQYQNNLAACDNCGRTFAPDRLAVHKRSCRSDASGGGSKPVQRERSPFVNRLPAPAPRPRTCAQCSCTEHDGDARFCEECGAKLEDAVATPPQAAPAMVACTACGQIWEGGKFCQDCGGGLAPVENTPPPPPPPSGVCSSCSFANKDGSHFCEDCGAPLGNSGDEVHDKRSPLRNRLPSASSTASTPKAEEPSARQWRQQTTTDLPSVPEEATIRPEQGGPSLSDDDGLDGTVPTMDLAPCPNCGRNFIVSRLDKHVSVCTKSKKRKVFDIKKARAPEDAGVVTSASKGEEKKVKTDWKAKSSAFRNAMRSARDVTDAVKEGKPLPPPTYTAEEHDHRVPCPHCGRKFAQETAERHIPKCATTINKPNAPPKRTPNASTHSRGSVGTQNTSSSSSRKPANVASLGSHSSSEVPPDVARMGVSPEKWSALQAKKDAEWDDAFGESPVGLSPCPHCNRKFVAKSLEIHLKSCGGRHGTSKKVRTSSLRK